MAKASRLHAQGVVYRDNQLVLAASMLNRLGRVNDAERVRSWITDARYWQ